MRTLLTRRTLGYWFIFQSYWEEKKNYKGGKKMPADLWTGSNTLCWGVYISIYALGAKGFLPEFSIWPVILGWCRFFVLLVGLLETRVKVPFSWCLNLRLVPFKQQSHSFQQKCQYLSKDGPKAHGGFRGWLRAHFLSSCTERDGPASL